MGMPLSSLESSFAVSHHLTKAQEGIKAFKFVLFSASAGLIQIAVFSLLFEALHWSYWSSYLPALVASVLWSFTANRKFTFKSVSNIPVAMAKVTFYYCLFTPLSTWWGDTLSARDWTMGRDAQGFVILIGTMVVNLITEFCVYRFWVYRRSINTSIAGEREQLRFEMALANSEADPGEPATDQLDTPASPSAGSPSSVSRHRSDKRFPSGKQPYR